jgi:hypothetical protein
VIPTRSISGLKEVEKFLSEIGTQLFLLFWKAVQAQLQTLHFEPRPDAMISNRRDRMVETSTSWSEALTWKFMENCVVELDFYWFSIAFDESTLVSWILSILLEERAIKYRGGSLPKWIFNLSTTDSVSSHLAWL